MKEVTSPIIAIVLVLVSVFVPIAFLGGLTGELYRQFAITISIAVIDLGHRRADVDAGAVLVVAEARGTASPTDFSGHSTAGLAASPTATRAGVVWMIRRGALALVLFAGWWSLAAVLWRITPGSLVPDEDQGFYIAAVILPDGVELAADGQGRQRSLDACQTNPNNQDVVAFTGLDFLGGGMRNNAATIFVTQIPWDKRKGVTTPQLVGDFFMKTGDIKEGLALAFAPPAIFGLGAAGGAEFYIRNRGEGGPQALAQGDGRHARRSAAGPDVRAGQLAVEAERAAAVRRRRSREGKGARCLGRRDLQHAVGDARQLLRQRLQQIRPHVAGVDERRAGVSQRVRTTSAQCGCARSATKWCRCARWRTVKYTSGPDSLDRYNNLPAVKVFASAAPGVSSGQAIARIQQVAREALPADFDVEFTGASFQEQQSSGTSALALGPGRRDGVLDSRRAV